MINPSTDRLVRRTTMGVTVVAAYFLLTADYGPQPNALDPIKNAILSAERAAKEIFFGRKKEDPEGATRKPSSNTSKDSP